MEQAAWHWEPVTRQSGSWAHWLVGVSLQAVWQVPASNEQYDTAAQEALSGKSAHFGWQDDPPL